MNRLSEAILQVECPVSEKEITDKIIREDTFEITGYLPRRFVNLLVLDPPYNLSKDYNGPCIQDAGKG